MQPRTGAHSAFSKGHATAGFVGNFNALTFTGEQHRVIAYYIASTNGFKANFIGLAGPSHTLTSINRTFF